MELLAIGLGLFLKVEAARAFIAMREAAEKDGITLRPNTAFRTMEHQQELYAAYSSGNGPLAAKPGYSNHQSGLSVDINRAPGDNKRTKKPDSPIDLWLQANAAKYGFYNDVKSEPWHYTYLPESANVVIASK